MKVPSVFLSCAAGLALAACAPELDNGPELDDDADWLTRSDDDGSSDDGEKVVHGSGVTGTQTWTFDVRLYDDGEVWGTLDRYDSANDATTSVDWACMWYIDADTVYLGGVVTAHPNPFLVGWNTVQVLRDNGNGKKVADETINGGAFPPFFFTLDKICTPGFITGLETGLAPFDSGNIKIADEDEDSSSDDE